MNLYDKALERYKEHENDPGFFNIKKQFFGPDEDQERVLANFFELAHDGMPDEIMDVLMGNLFIGFLMGSIYTEEQQEV